MKKDFEPMPYREPFIPTAALADAQARLRPRPIGEWPLPARPTQAKPTKAKA